MITHWLWQELALLVLSSLTLMPLFGMAQAPGSSNSTTGDEDSSSHTKMVTIIVSVAFILFVGMTAVTIYYICHLRLGSRQRVQRSGDKSSIPTSSKRDHFLSFFERVQGLGRGRKTQANENRVEMMRKGSKRKASHFDFSIDLNDLNSGEAVCASTISNYDVASNHGQNDRLPIMLNITRPGEATRLSAQASSALRTGPSYEEVLLGANSSDELNKRTEPDPRPPDAYESPGHPAPSTARNGRHIYVAHVNAPSNGDTQGNLPLLQRAILFFRPTRRKTKKNAEEIDENKVSQVTPKRDPKSLWERGGRRDNSNYNSFGGNSSTGAYDYSKSFASNFEASDSRRRESNLIPFSSTASDINASMEPSSASSFLRGSPHLSSSFSLSVKVPEGRFDCGRRLKAHVVSRNEKTTRYGSFPTVRHYDKTIKPPGVTNVPEEILSALKNNYNIKFEQNQMNGAVRSDGLTDTEFAAVLDGEIIDEIDEREEEEDDDNNSDDLDIS